MGTLGAGIILLDSTPLLELSPLCVQDKIRNKDILDKVEVTSLMDNIKEAG